MDKEPEQPDGPERKGVGKVVTDISHGIDRHLLLVRASITTLATIAFVLAVRASPFVISL